MRLGGDPVMHLAHPEASPEEIAEIRAAYGFDRPLHEQYLKQLRMMLRGDFGESFRFPVACFAAGIGKTACHDGTGFSFNAGGIADRHSQWPVISHLSEFAPGSGGYRGLDPGACHAQFLDRDYDDSVVRSVFGMVAGVWAFGIHLNCVARTHLGYECRYLIGQDLAFQHARSHSAGIHDNCQSKGNTPLGCDYGARPSECLDSLYYGLGVYRWLGYWADQ